MLQLAFLSCILLAILIVYYWPIDLGQAHKKKYKKPVKQIFAYKKGVLSYEEQEL